MLADYRVAFTRSLIRKAELIDAGTSIKVHSGNIRFNDDKIMDIRCVQLYEEMRKDKIDPVTRKGNWVQEYVSLEDIRLHLDSQFRYPERIRKLIDRFKLLS